jgi:ribosome maturation factor RimP
VGVESRRTRRSRDQAGPRPANRSARPAPGQTRPAVSDQPARSDRNADRTDRDTLSRLLEPVVLGAGFDLEDLAVTPVGRRRQVRVVVDADGGVDLDDVATLSERISATLDESGAMGERPYILEVTSPGVDRPLTAPRHWRRSAGRLVRAALVAGGEIAGRVVSADDDAVVLDVAGARRRLGYAELGRARVQVEFRRDDGGGG